MVAVDREAQRGSRRWLKPVVGASVPRGEEQRGFLNDLRASNSDAMLEIQGITSTPSELENWATSGAASDLLYFFCHARPRGADTTGSEIPPALGLGAGETDSPAELSKLAEWWSGPRETHPVVFLNACSSGQQDLVYGVPFVDFFVENWQAQAFVGTDWPIKAAFADVFGRRVLLELLKEGASLREAVRTVSDEAAEDSNYLPLIYAIYGLNTVQFADPLASDS